ncbi:MAG: DUF3127 domain-containing protein [Bacteroidales bacterium]|nr:DUF3127 domain-containing protein [Bacteroidales bacterium]
MNTIQGTFVKALPVTEGDSQRGHWVRGGFVIEYGEEYRRQVAFTVYGQEKVDTVSLYYQGIPVQVSFVPESREYNDRWYTELRCISINTIPQPIPSR